MRIAFNKVGRLTTRLLPPSQALVVSIHDVSPHTRAECEEIGAQLSEMGLQTLSWLVVPDHHRRGSFLEDADFCAWLCDLAAAEHEIVIHGYHHLREPRAGESLVAKFIHRIYTAGEGEFHDMDRETALALVTQAQAEFGELGIKPEGFIAPAWLLSEDAEEALKDAGIQYTTRLRHVRDLQSGRTHESQSLVWSSRSGWRRAASLLWNRTLFRRLPDNPLLRIAIHPDDVRHPKIWRQIRHCVSQGLASRLAFTYERWIARQRTFVPARTAR